MLPAQRAIPRIRQTATAHLTQTMNLLGLSRAEQSEFLNSVLASNPALELIKPTRCPTCRRALYLPGPCPVCYPAREGPIVFLATPPGRGRDESGEENLPEPAQPERLSDFLMRQIGPELSPEERSVANYLIARLDENGLLPESSAEAARYLHQPLAVVEKVLHTIQRCDPPGIGASSPIEALLIQVEQLAETHDVPQAVRSIILDHLEPLAHGEFGLIARALSLPRPEVEEAAKFIRLNLTPYPGRTFLGHDHQRSAPDPELYHEAEMVFRLAPNAAEGPLIVEVYAPLVGRLRVNPEIRTLVKTLSGPERENWEGKVEEAALVEKCLRQSQHTILRLAAILAEQQRAFILGTDRELIPMTRARIAGQLEVHESTISRAVSRKRAALPSGRIVPLSKFFDRSLSVRDVVRSIIAEENRPLTDTEVAGMLKERGIPVARRTVAKYRAMEGILPAALRRTQRAQRSAALSAS